MIYIIVLLLILIPVIRYDFLKKTKGFKIWAFLELLVLILLVGLRYRVGGDTLTYIDYFDEYPTIQELFNFDFSSAQFKPLWYVYNAIIKFIWNDFTFFQIVQAIIVNTIVFWFCKKNVKYFFSAILLYYIGFYFYFNMEILREVLAVCIFLLIFRFVQEKRYVEYYLFSTIAFFFHYSAMIMFIVPILYLVKNISWKTTLITAIGLFLLLSAVDISPLLVKLLLGNDLLNLKFESYSSLDDKSNYIGLITIIFPIILLMIVDKYQDKENEGSPFKNLMFLYVQLTVFTAFFPAMFSRMSNFIVPFYVVFILVSIEKFSFKIDKSIFSLRGLAVRLILFWFIFMRIYSLTKDTSDVMLGTRYYNIFYPYYSVFNPVTDAQREQFVELYKEID